MFNLLRKLQGTTTLDPPRPRKYAHVVCMLCVCCVYVQVVCVV
jgi:hypothetical protein